MLTFALTIEKCHLLPMFELALHSIVSSYVDVGINNVATCCGITSVLSVGPIASEKDPSDHHGRAPPKMKSPPRSETLLLSNVVRRPVKQNSLSTGNELSTFSVFRKNISVLDVRVLKDQVGSLSSPCKTKDTI